MSHVRLIERMQLHHEREAKPLSDRLRRSVVIYLNELLNTRRGSVPVDPEFGIPDLCNVAGSFAMGSIEMMSQSIIEAIMRYEPRLTNPIIKNIEENNEVITLKFELTALIKASQDFEVTPISMMLKVNSAGRVIVEATDAL